MKYNNFPHHDAEWEKIVEDAFASDAKMHVFSKKYDEKKKAMKESMEEKHMSKRIFQGRKKVVAIVAVAAAAVFVPSTVFAVSHMNAYFQKTGNYQQNLTIDTADSAVSTTPMSLQTGWLPEGMEIKDGKYHDAQDRGITMCFWKITDGNQILNHAIPYTVSQEQFTCGENTVLFAKKDVREKGDYNEVWVAFPNASYAVQMYVTSDITDEEVKKISENLSLTPADTETAMVWSGDAKEEIGDETPTEPFDSNNMQVIQIGDVIEKSPYLQNEDVSITINDASLQDTMDGITTDNIGAAADYHTYLNADGTVKDDVRTWYTRGDGINTLDKQDRQETLPQKVLVLHMTYTNNGTEPIDECVCPSLFNIADDGSLVTSLDTDEMYAEDTLGDLKYDRSAFSFATTHSSQKNNLTNLKAGESADVTLAFLVDEEQLDQLYLDVLYDDVNQGAPALDLRNLK